jgi:putative DNA primase/helicase
MFGITAPDYGYGKTYLADIVSAVATGSICPVTAQGEQREELDKHLAGALIGGADIICIDNVSRPLRSELLCQILTQPLVRLRPLGTSTTLPISTATTMLTTGVNSLSLMISSAAPCAADSPPTSSGPRRGSSKGARLMPSRPTGANS